MSLRDVTSTTIRVSSETKAKIVRIARGWRRSIKDTVDLIADAHLQSCRDVQPSKTKTSVRRKARCDQ